SLNPLEESQSRFDAVSPSPGLSDTLPNHSGVWSPAPPPAPPSPPASPPEAPPSAAPPAAPAAPPTRSAAPPTSPPAAPPSPSNAIVDLHQFLDGRFVQLQVVCDPQPDVAPTLTARHDDRIAVEGG